MASLPAAYRWLNARGQLPRMVEEALKLVGTVETPGGANSPVIMGWASEVGEKAIGYRYTADSVAWCGLFMAAVAQRAGYAPPSGPLYALNWGAFGTKVGQPILGDVLTFIRPNGGHVALYVGEDQMAYHVLGGNQGDAVGFTRIAKERMRAVRRPPYRVGPPASAKAWILASAGGLSSNEA
jgi:uncharacterized protein (TIGR02594 family)